MPWFVWVDRVQRERAQGRSSLFFCSQRLDALPVSNRFRPSSSLAYVTKLHQMHFVVALATQISASPPFRQHDKSTWNWMAGTDLQEFWQALTRHWRIAINIFYGIIFQNMYMHAFTRCLSHKSYLMIVRQSCYKCIIFIILCRFDVTHITVSLLITIISSEKHPVGHILMCSL